MKKRIIPLALLCAFLLTGCGLSEQWDTVREQYIDPAIERAEGDSQPEEDAVVAAQHRHRPHRARGIRAL